MHVKYFCSTHTHTHTHAPTRYIHLFSVIRSLVAEISRYRETKQGNKALNRLIVTRTKHHIKKSLQISNTAMFLWWSVQCPVKCLYIIGYHSS